MSVYQQFITTPTMADNFVAAYSNWADMPIDDKLPPLPASNFFDWARDQDLIGDDAGKFLCTVNWQVMPNHEESILCYSIIDFEDGSLAIRRDHEFDTAWMTTTPRNPDPAAYLPSEVQRLKEQRDELLAALKRIESAAECRDNTMGDAIRLLAVKAELAAAAMQARDAIAKAEAAL